MRTRRVLICWCIVFLSTFRSHAQSGIELPKPNTGALGIHLKLLQSIPYKAVTYGPYETRFAEGGKTVVVPVLWPYQNPKNKSIDEEGLEYKVYNLVSGNPVGSLGMIRASESITSPDLSVAAVCNDGKLEFYRLGGGGVLKPAAVAKEKMACSLGENRPSMATLSRNGQYLAMDGDGQRILIWDSRTAKLLTTLLSSDKITHLSFSSDSTMLLASAEDGTVHVWAIPSGQPIRTFDAQHSVQWADFVPGRPAIAALASMTETKTLPNGNSISKESCPVSVWDLTSGQRLSFFDLAQDWDHFDASVEALSSDGRLLIVGGHRNSYKFNPGLEPSTTSSGGAYDLRSGARVASIEPGHSFGHYLEVASDGMMIATLKNASDNNYVVTIWRIEQE